MPRAVARLSNIVEAHFTRRAQALTGGLGNLDAHSLSRGSGPDRRETGPVPFLSFLFEGAAPPMPEGRGLRREEIR